VATIAGLVLNCANSALYMANYNLVVRLLTARLPSPYTQARHRAGHQYHQASRQLLNLTR
jgi:hypothetical protein